MEKPDGKKEIKMFTKDGKLLSDDILDTVTGGCGWAFNDSQCMISYEYGTVSTVGFDETGKIEYFYCSNCQNTYSVYNR